MGMFNQPAAGGGFFKPAQANGHLILILAVHAIDRRYDDMRGADIDQATVDLVDLDDQAPEVRERLYVTHAGIVNKLVPGATMILGRIGQVQTKTGMAAWVLEPFRPGDDVRAEQWVTANQTRPQFANAPTPAPAPAPAAAWPNPAPAPAAPAAEQAPPGVDPRTGEITMPPGIDLTDPKVQQLLAQLQPTTDGPAAPQY